MVIYLLLLPFEIFAVNFILTPRWLKDRMFWFCELKNYFSSLAQRKEKRIQAEHFFLAFFVFL